MSVSNKKQKVIVVGGGTAGSVICSKLSLEYDVTVFEKSENKKIPLLNKIPLLIGLLYRSKNKYIKKRELDFNNIRNVPYFESNVIGGASAMNGCVHVLGIRSMWQGVLKKYNYNIEDLEHSFENNFTKKNEVDKISLRPAQQSKLDGAFQETFDALGCKKDQTDLINEPTYGHTINTTRKVFRSSVIDLKPYEKATIKINKKVTNLILNDENKIIGVMANEEVYTGDHVILSGGVIGTNELLMRPAIKLSNGEQKNLNLNAGKGIKDHVNMRINIISSKKIESLNIIDKSTLKKGWLFIKHLLGFDTLLIGTGATSSVNLDIDGDGVVDTRVNLLKFSEGGRLGSNGKYFDESVYGFSLSISSINPKSKGSIELVNSNIGTCKIKPNYLQNPEDVKMINKAIDFCMATLRTSPLKEYVLWIKDEEQIKENREEYLKTNGYSGYHLIGGCHNIVDENFQISKLGNVYVCDASIFDEFVSSNIHAPVVIIADLFVKRFLERRSKT